MKVLSVRQPFASLIAEKYKRIETRTWAPWGGYRGPLAIHASATNSPRRLYFDLENYFLCAGIGIDLFASTKPLGKIIATCMLLYVKEYTEKTFFQDEHLHRCYYPHIKPVKYGWVLTDVKKLDTPIPCNGKLGLWNFDLPDN